MNSSAFYNALVKRPVERNDEDVSTIFNHLRRLDVFERLHDAPLRSVCRTARLERHPANYVLFRKGQLATCWYILLSGSVFMNKQVYLPIGCFGKRSNMNLRRMSDCIVISPSDMIVIDYPDVQRITVHLKQQEQQQNTASNSRQAMFSSSAADMNCGHGQACSSSTAFPALQLHNQQHQHPPMLTASLPSSSSASLDVPIDRGTNSRRQFAPQHGCPAAAAAGEMGRLATKQQPQPCRSSQNNRNQHQQSHFPFQRFPAPPPPPSSVTSATFLPHPQLFRQQIPITNASISHRVPSPAPTHSSTSLSYPVKPTHPHPAATNSRTLGPAQHQQIQHQHTKSNSMTEVGKQQQNLTSAFNTFQQQQHIHSHEIEVPFVRAKPMMGPSKSDIANKSQMDQQNAKRLEENLSPPRPSRNAASTRAHTTSGKDLPHSKIYSKKENPGSPPQADGQETDTMKKRRAAATHDDETIHNSSRDNDNTLTAEPRENNQQRNGCQNADECNSREEAAATAQTTQGAFQSLASTPGFQRLSKIRLNIGGGTGTCKKNNSPDDGNQIAGNGQLRAANVRIRQPSPHQQQKQPSTNGNGQSATTAVALTANRIRQSTASTNSALTGDELDCFAGLPETAVDSESQEGEEEDDEEEDEEGSCPSHDSFQELRDNVRECLEKEPAQRSAEDLAVLIDFTASLPSLAPLPMAVKRQLCEKMVFAVVPHKGTPIMQHGERIDAWSVVVNGSVEQIHSDGRRVEHRVGDCFGARPIPQAQYNDGLIRTLADDCEFVLVEHGDFYTIMSTLSRHVERENDDNSGEVVREVERRMIDNQVELVITKASAERLLRQLLLDDDDLLLASSADSADSIATSPQMDSHFVEDFLLMHRVFMPQSAIVIRQLVDWFRTEPAQRDRVARIMLLWLNNHYEDFEGNDSSGKMIAFLNEFDALLGETKMYNHQSLLSITCSVKSQPRQLTLTRSERAEPLDFQMVGDGGGIFVLSVNADSTAERMGLKRGDEILEVNGQNFRKYSLLKATELIRESTHLSITLKTNFIGFKEALAQQDQVDSCPVFRPPSTAPFASAESATATIGPAPTATTVQCHSSAMPSRYQKKCSASMMGAHQQPQRERRSTLSAVLNQNEQSPPQHHQSKAGSTTPTGNAVGGGAGAAVSSKKVFNKLLHMIRGGSAGGGSTHLNDRLEIQCQIQQQKQMVDSADQLALPASTSTAGGPLRASRSNPDISAHALNATGPHGSCSSAASSCSSSQQQQHRHSSVCTNGGLQPADQVLKVYRSDQTFRYIPASADTNAKQLVHQALQEFGIHSHDSTGPNAVESCWWALYECSVSREGVTKQRRLPDSATNLAERAALNARLYLRDLQKEDSTLLPDELIPEVLKQARLTLYTLNAQCIATQLTLQDFAVFASIEPTEYVNHLFKLAAEAEENPCLESGKRRRGWARLAEFETLFNREMWWVTTEICCERNIYRRSKLVKKFIKIARHCHTLRNLNSMFAIISGLEKPAVRRLAHTWERVPGKYLKMLADLQQLMDPSRNMSRYRQHLAQLSQEPPLIPIYPVLRKDLTFAHEANPTFCGPRLINFEKLRMIAQMVRSIQHYSSVHYDPAELMVAAGAVDGAHFQSPDLMDPGTMRKGAAASMMAGIVTGRFGTSSGGSAGGGLSRKKLYERTLMLRRVKAYLQAMPVIDSEIDLDRISLECEPPALASGQSASVQQLHYQQQQPNNSMASGGTARRNHHQRLPSPSPSSLSSHSNQSSSLAVQQERHRQQLPKFGVESPQAVQKMLSLVHNSKIKARNPFNQPLNRTPHNSHGIGTLTTSAELPPIAFVQRKRSSVTSTTAEEHANSERAI